MAGTFYKRPTPEGADPRVTLLYDEMNRRRVPVSRIAKASGVSHRAITSWYEKSPTVANLEACLNTLGLTLTVTELGRPPVVAGVPIPNRIVKSRRQRIRVRGGTVLAQPDEQRS